MTCKEIRRNRINGTGDIAATGKYVARSKGDIISSLKAVEPINVNWKRFLTELTWWNSQMECLTLPVGCILYVHLGKIPWTMFGRERAPSKKTSGRWLDKRSVCQIWNRPIIVLNYQWGQMITVQPVPFSSFFLKVTTKTSPQLLARHWLVQSQSDRLKVIQMGDFKMGLQEASILAGLSSNKKTFDICPLTF